MFLNGPLDDVLDGFLKAAILNKDIGKLKTIVKDNKYLFMNRTYMVSFENEDSETEHILLDVCKHECAQVDFTDGLIYLINAFPKYNGNIYSLFVIYMLGKDDSVFKPIDTGPPHKVLMCLSKHMKFTNNTFIGLLMRVSENMIESSIDSIKRTVFNESYIKLIKEIIYEEYSFSAFFIDNSIKNFSENKFWGMNVIMKNNVELIKMFADMVYDNVEPAVLAMYNIAGD